MRVYVSRYYGNNILKFWYCKVAPKIFCSHFYLLDFKKCQFLIHISIFSKVSWLHQNFGIWLPKQSDTNLKFYSKRGNRPLLEILWRFSSRNEFVYMNFMNRDSRTDTLWRHAIFKRRMCQTSFESMFTSRFNPLTESFIHDQLHFEFGSLFTLSNQLMELKISKLYKTHTEQ